MGKRIIAVLAILFILPGISSCEQVSEEKIASNAIISNEKEYNDEESASAPKEDSETIEETFERLEYRGSVWKDSSPIAEEERDYDEVDTSFYGNVRYEPSTKTIIVSGKGKVSKLYFENNSINDWDKQKEIAKVIIFEEGITEISNCFSNMSAVKTIKFPKSLEKINGSFSGAKALETIEFSESLKRISGSFEETLSLKEIVIPANVERIENACFRDSALENIQFSGAIYIGVEAFNHLINLKKVIIPEGSVCEGAFQGCINLEEVIIEKNVKLKNWVYNEEDCDPVIEENFIYAVEGDSLNHYPKAYLYLPTDGEELPWGEGGHYKPIIVREGKSWEDYRDVPMEKAN